MCFTIQKSKWEAYVSCIIAEMKRAKYGKQLKLKENEPQHHGAYKLNCCELLIERLWSLFDILCLNMSLNKLRHVSAFFPMQLAVQMDIRSLNLT